MVSRWASSPPKVTSARRRASEGVSPSRTSFRVSMSRWNSNSSSIRASASLPRKTSRSCADNPLSRLISAFQHELDRLGEALPLVDLEAERAPSLSSDGIVACAAVVLGGLPVALDVALVLEALEGGVEGALVHIEPPLGELLDAFTEAPAVHRLER